MFLCQNFRPRLTAAVTLTFHSRTSSRTMESALVAVLTRPREPPLGRTLPAHLESRCCLWPIQ
eukprot:4514660-Prymnesium_polylepis.1